MFGPWTTWWARKLPLETLVWSETVTPYVVSTELITSVAASVAPNGTGELTISAISVAGQTISLTLTGGQPTRIYTIQMIVVMTDGNIYQLTANIKVDPALETDQPQTVPIEGFGPATVWGVNYAYGGGNIRLGSGS